MRTINNSSAKMSRFLKAFASRRRLDILFLLEKHNNLSLKDISDSINSNVQNTSLHTFKLLNAGLIAKRQEGVEVSHTLTSRGKRILEFIREMDKYI